MHRTRLSLVGAVAAACVSLVAVTSASAASLTKVVYAGPPPVTNQIAGQLLPKSFGKTYNPDINAFFRQRVTINAGDTVSFQLRGFHTIDLPGKSGTDLPLIVPGSVVAGVNDAAGSPFWFNGKVPSLGLNPQLFAPSKSKTYNGIQRVDSGAGGNGPPKPFNIKFTKPGTYKFFCDVHPGMVGFVVVKPKGQAIPSAKQDAAALAAQVTSDIKAAKKVATAKQPADTVSLGESTPGGVELYKMFPSTLTVNPGTVVTFTMSKNSRETHTATFGPAAYLKPLSKSFEGAAFSPIATYPSDPTPPITLTPTSHGNGFANVGALDRDPGTPQIGPSATIDFTTPGTYHFECLIHPFMQGTITVK